MEYVIKLTVYHLWKYVGDTWFFLLALLCVGYFAANAGKEKKRQHLVQYFIGLTVVYACPVTAWIIMYYCIGTGAYWRMFWLFPMVFIIAVVLAECLGKIRKKWKQILSAGTVVLLLVWAGNFMYTSEMYQKAPNAYKLPEETFLVCDRLEEHAQGNPVRVVVPNRLVPYIRQYKGDIIMPYGRQVVYWQQSYQTEEALALYYEMNSPDKTADSLSGLAEENLCNYLVLDKADPRNENMKNTSYEAVADAGAYVIYYNDEIELKG